MHHHLEVIIPPTNNVEESLNQVLERFNEEYKDEEGYITRSAFYDYYVLGGRWSGCKIEHLLGKDKIDKFTELLVKEKITVSGVVFGKETLKPESQIDKVNKLWNKFFPNSPVKECPLFDNYKNDYGDVLPLGELPKTLTASRVIIAKQHWEDPTKIEAEFMYATDLWNGVTFQDTNWNGNVKEALNEYTKKLKNMSEEFVKKNTPQDNWICVTVDYHS